MKNYEYVKLKIDNSWPHGCLKSHYLNGFIEYQFWRYTTVIRHRQAIEGKYREDAQREFKA